MNTFRGLNSTTSLKINSNVLDPCFNCFTVLLPTLLAVWIGKYDTE